jgi:transposase
VPPKLLPYYEAIRRKVREESDLTLAELRAWLLESYQVSISQRGMWKTLRQLDLTRKKKTQHASEQNRPDVTAERQAWRDAQPKLDASKLIFIDESWVTTNMARRYGRAPRGERVIGHVPHGHWMTSTFIAGLRHDGITAPCLFNCAIDGELFLAYVEQQLAPSLAPGDIVIADNLSSHKVAGVREAIEARGARLWFLPSYSPDLNPIEHAFAKLKELLRAEAPRTIEALWAAVGCLLSRFTHAECANYLAHNGYRRSG